MTASFVTRGPARRVVRRPGLEVVLAAERFGGLAGLVVVEAAVGGGQAPFSMALYLNGEPVDDRPGGAIRYDERAGRLCGVLGTGLGAGTLALTARVVDAHGRWGAASLVLPSGPVSVR